MFMLTLSSKELPAILHLKLKLSLQLNVPSLMYFVVPVVTNPIMYLVAIVVGSIVGMALLAVLKKPLDKEA